MNISLRCWDEDKKQMEYRDAETIFKFGWPLVATRNFKVMLSTNLLDKNGKEIFEGDICKVGHAQELCEIRYQGAAFVFENKLGQMLVSDHHAICEIIGNIYENPSLLKPEEGKV